MADLSESNEWTPGIYQLETSDPVLGGPEGIDNLQGKQLANRTKWLKDQIEKVVEGVTSIGKAAQLATARNLKFKGAATGTGSYDGSADTDITLTLANSGVVAGSYSKVMVNAKGLVTEGVALTPSDLPEGITPPQFDRDKSLATTEFAKRMGVEYSGFTPLTASTVLGASSVGGMVVGATGTPINITLPPTAGVPEGATVEIVAAGAGAVTVLAAALDVLASPIAGAISVVLGMGDNAEFVKVSSTWRLRGGSMALKYAAVMSGPNWITPAQFTSDKSFATTEFVKRMGVEWSGFISVSASTVLGSASAGGIVSASSSTAINVTLPPTGSVGPGAMIMVLSGGVGAVTLLASNGEQITNSSSSAITLVLGQGDSAILTRLTGEWRLVGGSHSSKYSSQFGASLFGNGYQKLPSGLIIQWGIMSATCSTTVTSTAASYPIAFPNAVLCVTGSRTIELNTSNTPFISEFFSGDTTTARVTHVRNSGSIAANWKYMAIGF